MSSSRAATTRLAFGLAPCLVIGVAAAACGDGLPAQSRLEAGSAELRILFAPRGMPIRVGQHFALEIEVCAPDAAKGSMPLRVDADMPAHRHGMNYRATVKPLGDGRYLAEGLMFHMPGRWRFIFDAGDASRALTATREIVLE